MQISNSIIRLAEQAETALAPHFARIDRIAFANTAKVLDAFREHRVAANNFDSTSGYGYDDKGREVLDRIWADVMGAEAALVRQQIVSGTHALTVGLFGLLRPGDVMLSVAGKPYDTLEEVIGITGTPGDGSLRDFGVGYDTVELTPEGSFDWAGIEAKMRQYAGHLKMVFVQRSKGYLNRRTLSVEEIGGLVAFVRAHSPDSFVVVDNCYGEFTEEREPCAVGADLVIGSLIKNPGGGMAETGGSGGKPPRGGAGILPVDLARNRCRGRCDYGAEQTHVQGTFLCAAHGGAGTEDGASCGVYFRCTGLPGGTRVERAALRYHPDRHHRVCGGTVCLLSGHPVGIAGRFTRNAGALGNAGVCRPGDHGGGRVRAGLLN